MFMLKKNIKVRRRIVFLIISFLFLIFLFWLFFFKKNYQIEYTKDDYYIIENFDKDKDYYNFKITKDDLSYTVSLANQNFISKKLIKHIETFTNEEETCIKVTSNKLRFYPLCLKNNEQISYWLVSEEMKNNFTYSQKEEMNDTYQNITIKDYNYQDYYIWNYHGFYHLNNEQKESIDLFTNDIYEPKLLYQVDNFLFIPSYENNYYFTSAYILNMKDGSYEEWQLKEKIYFDSVILGVYDKELYLVDKHEKKEWTINPSKKKIKLIAESNEKGLTYQNGFQKVMMTKLTTQDYYFTGINVFEYQIDNGLYKSNLFGKEKILNESPKVIVGQKDDTVYYLKEDKLYMNSPFYGEVLLMSYFEWNFNYQNVIFIKK